MMLLRRGGIFGTRYGLNQIVRNVIISRRWFCQSRIRLNQNNTSVASKDNLKEKDPKYMKKEQKKAKTLDEIIKLKIASAPKSSSEESEKRKLSPLEFMNQGKYRIPDNWRKNEFIPEWKKQKYALNEKFKGGSWNPSKKLSREEMESVRMLKREIPNMTSKEVAEHFKISPEAVRRILRSKWKPSLEEEEEMYDRWKKRGEKVKGLFAEKYGITKKVIVKHSGTRTTVKVKKFTASSSSKRKKTDLKQERAKQKKKRFEGRGQKRLQDIIF